LRISLLPFTFLLFTLDFMLHKIYDSLLTLVYPQICHSCGEKSVENSADGAACRACWGKTRVFSGAETLCAKCGKFLQGKPSNFQTFCHQCDEHFYDAARAVGIYENALSACVLQIKSEPFISRKLCKLFISAFAESPFQDPRRIIPVPLSKQRFLERGFNQAEILADALAKETKIPVDKQSLARKIHSPIHRAAMDRKAREMSVKNAFEVKRPRLVENENILLIDDVFTSGATVSSCAKALKEKGADKVYVLTLARAA
jgi:ComF family protein